MGRHFMHMFPDSSQNLCEISSPHGHGEQTGSERVSNLAQVTQLQRGQAEFGA